MSSKDAMDMDSTEGMEPMDVEVGVEETVTSDEKASGGNAESWKFGSSLQDWTDWLNTKYSTPRRYKLIEDKNVRQKSLYTLQFAVMTSAINTKMLNPNYPLMVSPGIHEDSFPDTDPFDFNTATYFLPMMSLLGVAIASIFLGQISDRVGRKPVLLVLAVISGGGSIAKYFTRNEFWPFAITNLVFGFFLGNLPVAMAYVGDVFVSKKEKERQLSIIVANFVMGNSGGGIIAILMQSAGLFSALWVGAGLMFLSAISISWWLIEPGDVSLQPIGTEVTLEGQEEEEELQRPETIDQCTLWNIIGGALADNFGSTGLFPLCLSPLALETFTVQPEEQIMSVTGYQWLSVCVAFMVVPSTFVTPYIFRKIGVAGTCVVGNAMTAIVTMALLLIATEVTPASTASFAGFVIVLYAGFPVTVWSQLTTGPMLDILAPPDKIGFVQGLNNSAMNFGMALAPWLFGILADQTSTNTAIWTGVGISFGAALINAPLMRKPHYGPEKKKPPSSKRVLPGEDKELIEKALAGEFVDPDEMWLVNIDRIKNNKTPLVPKVKPYEEDMEDLNGLREHAEQTFRSRVALQGRVLAEISKPERQEEVSEFCELFNKAIESEPEIAKEANDQLGQWVADYLADNGYNPHLNSLVIKQMVLAAFPSITREKVRTVEHLEEDIVRVHQVMKEYLEYEENEKYNWTKTTAYGAQGRFYS